MVNYIIDPNYLPKIEITNFKEIVAILHNSNMSEYINKNINQIVSFISKCHSDQLF
jgi:hypothetical protein